MIRNARGNRRAIFRKASASGWICTVPAAVFADTCHDAAVD